MQGINNKRVEGGREGGIGGIGGDMQRGKETERGARREITKFPSNYKSSRDRSPVGVLFKSNRVMKITLYLSYDYDTTGQYRRTSIRTSYREGVRERG
jgi:hypothetical protein